MWVRYQVVPRELSFWGCHSPESVCLAGQLGKLPGSSQIWQSFLDYLPFGTYDKHVFVATLSQHLWRD
jgi:hypothetical protein